MGQWGDSWRRKSAVQELVAAFGRLDSQQRGGGGGSRGSWGQRRQNSGGGHQKSTGSEGLWDCVACGYHGNWQSRRCCFSCVAPRPATQAAAAATGATSKRAAKRARKAAAQAAQASPAAPTTGTTDGAATSSSRPAAAASSATVADPAVAAVPPPGGTQGSNGGTPISNKPLVDPLQGAMLLGLKWPGVGDLTSRYSIPKPWLPTLSAEDQARELLKHEPSHQLGKAELMLEKLRSMHATQVELDGENCPRAAETKVRIADKEREVERLGKNADVTGGAAANIRIQEARSHFAGNEAVRVQRAARGLAESDQRRDNDLRALDQAEEEIATRRQALLDAHRESTLAWKTYHAQRDSFAEAVSAALLTNLTIGDVHLPDADESDEENVGKDPQVLYNLRSTLSEDSIPALVDKPPQAEFAVLSDMWARWQTLDPTQSLPPMTYQQLGADVAAVKFLVGQALWADFYGEAAVTAGEIMPCQLAHFAYVAINRANLAITINEEQKRLAQEAVQEARTTQKRARLALW